jgi:hypothetical protein
VQGAPVVLIPPATPGMRYTLMLQAEESGVIQPFTNEEIVNVALEPFPD